MNRDDWTGTALERAIWEHLRPGFGHYMRSILDALGSYYTRNSIRRCMSDMRRRGLIDYAAGHGFWARCPSRTLEKTNA